MARGNTLEQLIARFHNEVGDIEAPSYGVGARASVIRLLQRVQETLWEDYDWPFLQIKKDVNIQAGSRRYDIPDGLAVDRIQKVQVKYGGSWGKVNFGIDEDREYKTFDSDVGDRNDPVRRWDYYYDTDNNTEQLEVWPIPATNSDATTFNGYMRVTGIKTLSNLVAESDTADLDGNLIVLFAAAEALARDRSDDAAAKLEAANRLHERLKSNTSSSESFSLGSMDMEEDEDCGRTRIRAVYGDTSGA